MSTLAGVVMVGAVGGLAEGLGAGAGHMARGLMLVLPLLKYLEKHK